MPVSVAVSVGSEVESVVTVRTASRTPMALGAKVTVMVQVALSAREVQLLVWLKSVALVPLIAMLVTFTVEAKVVVFVTVSVADTVPPMSTLPKSMEVGEREAVVGTGGMRNATTKPSCGVRPAGVDELFASIAAKSVVK